MNRTGKHTVTDLEWKNRVLCRDESCIGVIGKDGRCKECGRKSDGGKADMTYDSDEADDIGTEESAEKPEEEIDEKNDTVADEEWKNRVLCSDGSCIGVIGPDGMCKECGKSL